MKTWNYSYLIIINPRTAKVFWCINGQAGSARTPNCFAYKIKINQKIVLFLVYLDSLDLSEENREGKYFCFQHFFVFFWVFLKVYWFSKKKNFPSIKRKKIVENSKKKNSIGLTENYYNVKCRETYILSYFFNFFSDLNTYILRFRIH